MKKHKTNSTGLPGIVFALLFIDVYKLKWRSDSSHGSCHL